MNWASFQTHNDAPEQAFESMCNQLFERWCRRTYGSDVQSFRAINGAGGDGGVEAYVQLKNGDGIGHQAKWFSNSIEDLQIRQIYGSITTAKKVRPQIKHYIICVPRNLASLKMGKGSQIVKNSEETRVNSLLEKIKIEHPELTVEFWDEHRVLEELQQSGAEGIYRFWFEKEEITNEIFKNNFMIAKSGWLRNRYIPALHMQGVIATAIGDMLRTKEARGKLFEAVSEIQNEMMQALEILDTCYEEFNQSGIEINFSNLKKSFENIMCISGNILNAVYYGDDLESQIIDEINYREILRKLEDKPQKSGLAISIYLSRFKRTIYKLMEIDIENIIRYAGTFLRHKNTMIIGDPGTGKTHGLAYAVQDRIDKGYPAIIIQAKNAPVTDGWGVIIAKSMALSNTWTSEDLWGALEACAARLDVKRAAEQIPPGIENENTNVLICVDGIDEALDQAEWINRIGELTAIKALHPRMCFCISGRPHVFQDNKLDNTNSSVKLLPDGDVQVNKLFDSYIAYYKINTVDAPWIKWAIQSPLALKLFCELYTGATITSNEPINLSVSSLIQRKLAIVEKELITIFDNKWSENEAVALNSLVSFGGYFLDHHNIVRSDACHIVMQAQHTPGILTAADAGRIVDHFCNCGLLIEYVRPSSKPLEPPKRYYQFSYTQLTDYLIAISGIEQVKDGTLPLGIKINHGSRAMVSLMLLSDYNLLVGDNGLLEQELPSDEILHLRLFALANAHYQKGALYSQWVREVFLSSKTLCRSITEGLIIKVARQQGHPLGAILVHEVLKDIPSMAARDNLWSVPDRLPRACLYAWGGISDNPVTRIQLSGEDRFDGLPLLFAWTLTSVDEGIRHHCRTELVKWGINNINQLICLLQLTFSTNDVQMKEDLASIACSVTCLSKGTTEEISLLANWATNVAFRGNMEDCTNAIIRQSCRAIVEKAFELGAATVDAVQLARPPYNTNEYLLPTVKDVLEGKEHAFFPISGDLDWYVVKKAYEPFFGYYRDNKNNAEQDSHDPVTDLPSELIKAALDGHYGELTPELRSALQTESEKRNSDKRCFCDMEKSFNSSETEEIEQNEEEVNALLKKMLEEAEANDVSQGRQYTYHPLAERLLKQYEDQYTLTVDDPHKLVKAMCYSFMQQWGWNYKEFVGQPNGEKEGEVLGVDIAIIREYGQETHGGRSQVMSFKEKYVWLAVHNVIGFFSDRLEFEDRHDRLWKKLTDYNEVINIENSSREVYKESENVVDISQWFLPSEICPQPLATGLDRKQMLVDWIVQDTLFDTGPWLHSEGTQLQKIYDSLPIKPTTWYSFNIYSISTEKTTQGQSILWATAFITGKDDFDLLRNDLETGVLGQSLANEYEAACDVKCNCYVSPVDVVMMPWLQEINYISEKYTIKDSQVVQYNMIPAVTKVMHHLIGEGETEYKIPSKIIRQALGITSTTGKVFFSRAGEVVSFASKLGENYGESQEVLFCCGDILDGYLQNEGKVMFWVVRLLREADPGMKEQLGVYNYRDRVLLVWLEDGVVKSSIISDVRSE